MKRHLRVWLAAVLLAFAGFACESKPAPGAVTDAAIAPEAVAKKYLDARFAEDVQSAIALTAQFPGITKEDLEKEYKPSSFPVPKALKPKAPPEVRNAKIDGELAVVVMMEKPTDPDPVYLIKQEGAWRVLSEVTGFDKKAYQFSPVVIARYKELEKWFDAQHRVIREQLKK